MPFPELISLSSYLCYGMAAEDAALLRAVVKLRASEMSRVVDRAINLGREQHSGQRGTEVNPAGPSRRGWARRTRRCGRG